MVVVPALVQKTCTVTAKAELAFLFVFACLAL